jgi:hypothetical protein
MILGVVEEGRLSSWDGSNLNYSAAQTEFVAQLQWVPNPDRSGEVLWLMFQRRDETRQERIC